MLINIFLIIHFKFLANYSPGRNHITIPAVILNGYVFDSKRPMYLNFGALGFVIGHEITHGFDSGGRLYDENGQN